MTSEEIYEDLMLQYDNLTLDEKNAILVYKSKLYLLLNPMTNIPNFLKRTEEDLLQQLDRPFLEKVFEEIKKILFLPKNLVTRRTIFSSIDFSSLETCMHSLKRIYLLLEQAHGKMILPDNLTVYRGISIPKEDSLMGLSQSKLVSTGLMIEDTESFLFQKDKTHILFMEVEKGTSVLATPYSLVSMYERGEDALANYLNQVPMTTLKVIKRHPVCQKELIFYQEDLIFEEKGQKECELEEDGKIFKATIHKIKVSPKQKEGTSYQYQKKNENS